MSFNILTSRKLMLASAVASSMLLTACGSDSDDTNYGAFSYSGEQADATLDSSTFAVFSTSASYDASSLSYGDTEDRELSTALSSSETNFGISAFDNKLFYLDRTNGIVSQYNVSSDNGVTDWLWQASVNDIESDDIANPYTVVKQDDSTAWVINYGSDHAIQINTDATKASEFRLTEFDLSDYTVEGATYPRMSDAVIYNDTLFVVMQRLDAYWSPSTAYIAAIDLTTLEEIDTDTSTDGLKGIALNITNPGTLEVHNGMLYVSGHGPYYSNSGVGVDMIDATTYEVTSLVDNTTLAALNDESGDTAIYYHINDVEPVSDSNVYFTVNMEQGYTTVNTFLYQVDPTSSDAPVQVDIASGLNSDTTLAANDELVLGDLEKDSDSRLWVGVKNSDNPGLLVLDTDTNTQNNEYVELELLPSKIVILNAE